MKHTVVRLDNMQGTHDGTKLYSVEFASDLDNGSVVKLSGLKSGEREIWTGATPAADSKLDEVVLIASPEVMYDERLKNFSDFYNIAANGPMRAYGFCKHDTFSATAEAFDGTPTVGGVIELQAKTKMKAVASATSGSTQIGECIAIEDVGLLKYYVIKVK